MIDLRNIKGGKKLIKKIIGDNTDKNQPWSKHNQYQLLRKQKNCLNSKNKK